MLTVSQQGACGKARTLLTLTPSRRRQKGRFHPIQVPGPVEGHNMLTVRPQSKFMPPPFSGQIEESQKVQNRRVLLPESKDPHFLLLFYFCLYIFMQFNMVVIV